jgi:hypothetical protein
MPKKKPAAEPAPASSPAASGPGGKLGLMVALMRRPEGAEVYDLMTATGWQEHSVRGAIAGSLKRVHGFTIVSEKVGTSRVYRIAEPNAGAEATDA